MAAKIESKTTAIEKATDWGMLEEAGENVLQRFREDLKDIGSDLDMFKSRMAELLGTPMPRMMLPTWKPTVTPLDVEDTSISYKVHMSLPGVPKEFVEIKFLDQVLEIDAESKSMKESEEKNYVLRERNETEYHRRLSFPMPVLPEKADAKLEHGVLTVTVPKLKPAKEVRLKLP
jgi:HSP20 family protein